MRIKLPKLLRIKPIQLTTRSAIALTIAALITVEAALFTREYCAAAHYLKENDPREGANLNGTLVFARPKLYRRGQQLRLEEVVDHLIGIGFARSDHDEPGTFRISTLSKPASGTIALPVDGPRSAGTMPAHPGDRARSAGRMPALPGTPTLRINSRLPEFPGATLTFQSGRIDAISIESRSGESRSVDQVEIEPETLISFMRMVRDEPSRRINARRVLLSASDLIPSFTYDAVRASEDKRFESSNGIDELGIARSVFNYLTNGFQPRGSGSGITQQLMKNAVLKDTDKTIERKSREIFLALAATRMMSAQEIFCAYSNSVYLGHVENGPTLIGFEAAARELLGTSVKDLTLAQAATLAGMLDKPETYLRAARANDYSLIRARRERVLKLMRASFPGRYSNDQVTEASHEPLQFVFSSERQPESSLDLISKPFQNFAAAALTGVLGADSKSGDFHIFTTIEPSLQRAANRAVNDQLNRLDPLLERARRRLPRNERGGEPIQASLVAMDAQTGEILAMVSGRNAEFNYATAQRSPGSAIKPFVYLNAIAAGGNAGEPFTAATIIDPKNDPVDDYRPSTHIGLPATVRRLVARSDNGAAVVAAHRGGLHSVRDLIMRLTGSRSHRLTGMLAIGGSAGCELSPLALCEGYSVFPNNGLKIQHTTLAAVYCNGLKIDLPRNAPERMTAGAPAFVLTQMMRSVLEPGGTAAGALARAGLSNKAAMSGKTGTGQVADLWFVGFSRRLIVAVWVGMPNNLPSLRMEHGFEGATAALPIWESFIRNGVRPFRPDLLESEFEIPDGVKVLMIDPNKGCVTGRPGIQEYFVAGREPRRCAE